MTQDAELDALENNLAVRGKQDREMSNHYVHRMEVDRVAAKSAITTLRAQLAEAHKDGSQLAAWQCLFDDGKTGIVCDDWGNQYCAMQRRADRAEAALAAQIEVDAGIAGCYDLSIMSSTEADARAQAIARHIRNQPHDRTALDRMLVEAREKALREAADELRGQGYGNAVRTILALIEKPNAG